MNKPLTTTTLLLASAALGAGCANWHPMGSQEMRGGMAADWYNHVTRSTRPTRTYRTRAIATPTAR